MIWTWRTAEEIRERNKPVIHLMALYIRGIKIFFNTFNGQRNILRVHRCTAVLHRALNHWLLSLVTAAHKLTHLLHTCTGHDRGTHTRAHTNTQPPAVFSLLTVSWRSCLWPKVLRFLFFPLLPLSSFSLLLSFSCLSPGTIGISVHLANEAKN